MKRSDALVLPKGTKFKPIKDRKQSNYYILGNIEELELLHYNCYDLFVFKLTKGNAKNLNGTNKSQGDIIYLNIKSLELTNTTNNYEIY